MRQQFNDVTLFLVIAGRLVNLGATYLAFPEQWVEIRALAHLGE
ncbi:hypothetical protein [Paenibacillus sanguinis]|nr:hypothetical protein [Paenibacillus sanguinis]